MFGQDSREFCLGDATPEDIPQMLEIFSKAYASDRYMRVKCQNEDPKVTCISEGRLLRLLRKYTVIKAFDTIIGDTIGWACWARRGFEEPNTTIAGPAESGDGSNKKPITEKMLLEAVRTKAIMQTVDRALAEGNDSIVDQKTNKRLEDIEAALTEYYQHLSDQKCMILEHIAVYPVYQRLGVGTALVRWGTKRADKEGIPCWLHASEAGHMLFKWQGFEDVGIHKVNLDLFSTKPYGGRKDGMWGWYTHRYMKRPYERGDAEAAMARKARGSAMKSREVRSREAPRNPRTTAKDTVVVANKTGNSSSVWSAMLFPV
jgi:GNAT superfamily N-acetyltransferase